MGKQSFVYENGTLKMILNPEGYVTKTSAGQYQYYLKDHLGNNREVIAAKESVSLSPQQEINYYPFGMPHPVVSQPRDGINPEKQPYKFGGKELDEMHGLSWYDFVARPYCGIIPGFQTMDPLCEKYYWISPYAYCLNNPINAIDPDGRDSYLLIWFSAKDETGHASIAVDNYKQ